VESYEHSLAYRGGDAAAAAEMGKSWQPAAAAGEAEPPTPAVGSAPLVRT